MSPCPLPSKLIFMYFVSFVKDHSRVTWIYLLKSRSEVFFTFKVFYSEIKNQFNSNIKILRSDNVKEYLDNFKHFLGKNRILHQFSCIYTPQQNGVAERKNRHLLDITRTLLFHRWQVPKESWGETILTACYLINRMPSSGLQHKIPYFIMYPMLICSLYLLRFLGLCFVIIIVLIRQNLILGLYKGFFLVTLELRKL